jgi:pimeloyl-ACP methyl ester carboxylesterase
VSEHPRIFDPELRAYAYPRPVQFHEFESQGQELHMAYMSADSDKPSGHTALLLHGKNFSGAYWEPTIRELVARNYRVIAPDQIGFGKSTKPHSYQFTFQALADNTRGLLDRLGVGRVNIVGHSMGGMLGIRFALMFPELVDRLTLVNPIGLEDWKTLVPYRPIDEQFADELEATADSIRAYFRSSYFGGEWRPEYDELVAFPAGWTKDPEYSTVAWNAALTSDMIFTQPVLYEFPLLKSRTLLIIGQRDRTAFGRAWASHAVQAQLGNYPLLGQDAARAIPGAQLVELPGVGHLPQVEAFESYLSALLAFLASPVA